MRFSRNQNVRSPCPVYWRGSCRALLLFRTKKDTLVLIDEPEISLHVVWQQEFLEDLAKITELASFDVLIATHSPELIHKRWDLTVELRSPRVEAEVATVP